MTSIEAGQNFRRADFPDRGVQVWSFLQDDADPKWMLAGASSRSAISAWRRRQAGQLQDQSSDMIACSVSAISLT
jgi:hypothetical protein